MSGKSKGNNSDGWFESSPLPELQYFRNSIRKAAPHRTDQEIDQAIEFARKTVPPEDGRTKLKACVLLRLGV